MLPFGKDAGWEQGKGGEAATEIEFGGRGLKGGTLSWVRQEGLGRRGIEDKVIQGRRRAAVSFRATESEGLMDEGIGAF